MLLTRQEVREEDKWKVNDIFKDDSEWENTFNKLNEDVLKIIQFKGFFKQSAGKLADFFDFYYHLISDVEKLAVYSHMKKDEDTKNDVYRSMNDKAHELSAKFNEITSWVIPEILELDDGLMDSYLKSEALAEYRFHLLKIYKMKPHVLTENEERIMSLSELPLSCSEDAFGALSDADIIFPSVSDCNGVSVELTHSKYMAYLRSGDRVLRENAWRVYHRKYDEYATTFSVLLQNKVRAHFFNAKVRKYDNCLHASLFENNIDSTVYTNLIDTVKENIGSLHRYIEYRKKKLNLDVLHFYDLYVPLVEYGDFHVKYDDGVDMVLKSVEVLGEEYCNAVKDGLLSEGWVDKFENRNKRSGAYSTGGYLTKPYILLNYNSTLDAVSTLAHEAGHSMHSYMTNKYQPAVYSGYPIFLAEVASIFNEELLNDYLIKKSTDNKLKAYIVNSMIEDIRGTLFRQTLFAEFELKIHDYIENGIPLTVELLKKEYRKLYEFYYGESFFIDDEVEIEWARIPHFYYNFYVYQYSTGISAAIALFKRVINGGDKEREQYLEFLKSGNSDYPIDILKKAGVDMNSKKPVEDTIKYFDYLLDLLIKLEG